MNLQSAQSAGCCLRTSPIIFLFFSISNECQTSSRKIQWLKFREKNANNVSKFKDELQTVNWSEVRDSSDPSSAYDIFLRKYTDIYNKRFPLKKVKIKNNGFTKPWISKALLKSIKKKNILYRRLLSNPTCTREISYKNDKKIYYLVLYVPLSKIILKRNLSNANRI